MEIAALVIAGLALASSAVIGAWSLRLQHRLASIEEDRRRDELARQERERALARHVDVDVRFDFNPGGTPCFVLVGTGAARAKNVRLEPIGGQFKGTRFIHPPQVDVLHPGQEFRIPMLMAAETPGPPFDVKVSWRDEVRAHGKNMIVS